jgi:antitoxin component of MazEF toxin-antitoxin module
MIKKLSKHGHSQALIIDQALLQAAGLSKDVAFQITINPSGGLIIQSVDENTNEKFEKHYAELSTELFDMMKSLSKK